MELVFDATPLIYFARMRILDKIARLKAEKAMPSGVYHEVVEKGGKKGMEDALFVEKLVSNKSFSFIQAKASDIEYFMKFRKMAKADAEVLALAKERKATAIIDESRLRAVAEASGIGYAGSIFILFKLHDEKIIAKADIKPHIDGMIRLGWRCSTELYARILEEIGKL